MKWKSSFLLFLFLGTLQSIGLAESRHEHWLEEEVAWIIGSEEKKEFESLNTDEERDRFIESFWALRDPTRGTVENEFKEEHYRRLKYVNEQFREGNTPGWKTDRGRVFVIHGAPVGRRIEGDLEFWDYPANPNARYYHGALTLVFERGGSAFQPRAISESRMGQQQLEVYDRGGRHNTVPTVQSPRFRLVAAGPGVGSGGSVRTSSGETDRYIADMLRSPGELLEERRSDEKRRMDAWKELTGEVKPGIAFGQLDFSLRTASFIRGAEAFVFFAAEMNPTQLELAFGANEVKEARADFFCEILDTSDQYQVDFLDTTRALADSEFETTQHFGMADRFRVAPGDYTLRCLVQDVNSRKVGEQKAPVTLAKPSGEKPVMSSLILTQFVEPVPEGTAASETDLRFQQMKFPPISSRLIDPGLPVFLFFEVYSDASVQSLVFDYRLFDDQQILLKVPLQPLAWREQEGRYAQALQFDFSKLPAGTYSFLVKVLNSVDRTFVQQLVEFSISPEDSSG